MQCNLEEGSEWGVKGLVDLVVEVDDVEGKGEGCADYDYNDCDYDHDHDHD